MSRLNKGLFTSKSNEWSTPQSLFDELNSEFNFTLDPASTHENAKCEKYYTQEDDGLNQPWADESVFCNPPYGREIGQWVKKAYEESLLLREGVIVLLIPARTDTKYWHEYIFGKAEVRFLKGRVKFGEAKQGAPFPSAVIVYNGNETNI